MSGDNISGDFPYLLTRKIRAKELFFSAETTNRVAQTSEEFGIDIKIEKQSMRSQNSVPQGQLII